jgi:hypothetical protein
MQSGGEADSGERTCGKLAGSDTIEGRAGLGLLFCVVVVIIVVGVDFSKQKNFWRGRAILLNKLKRKTKMTKT